MGKPVTGRSRNAEPGRANAGAQSRGREPFADYSEPRSVPIPLHSGIRRAIEFIHRHHAERLTLEQVADQACLSKYHFSRLFHQAAGVTFQEYLAHVRIQRARELMTTDPYRSVTRIALEAGFGTLRNCECLFKRVVGTSPSAYRAQVRAAQYFSRGAQDRAGWPQETARWASRKTSIFTYRLSMRRSNDGVAD